LYKKALHFAEVSGYYGFCTKVSREAQLKENLIKKYEKLAEVFPKKMPKEHELYVDGGGIEIYDPNWGKNVSDEVDI
jgi:hypothetical protein